MPETVRHLSEVAARLHAAPRGPRNPDPEVTGVGLDSRTVAAGDLYAAVPGARTHGARFSAQAAGNGAVAVLTDPAGEAEAVACGLPVLVVARPRDVLGGLAGWLYGEPAERLLTFGVTGTNGKTTTTYLLDAALRRGGARTGLIGTVETRIGDERVASVRTTPEAPEVHRLLARMVSAGATACSMEVSSHALAQHRVDGIVFDVAGFTNLSQDHLDFHPTMADYFAAKSLLFTPEHARRGVVCVDDEWGRRLAGTAGVPVVTVSGTGMPADWTVTEQRPDGPGTAFVLRGPDGGTLASRCPLPGDFNVANTVLALVMLVAAGVRPSVAAGRLAGADAVPGRMERVPGSGAPGEPLAVVDYAHTPSAVAAALRALRPAAHGPLVVVLGAGGDRDPGKRAGMGAAAALAADVVVVTDDNPRSEDPATIRAAVLGGARAAGGGSVLEVAGRAEAIAIGVEAAWSPDPDRAGVLLVAGKGHETGQEVAGTVHPFDDRAVLGAALAAAGSRAGGRAAGESQRAAR